MPGDGRVIVHSSPHGRADRMYITYGRTVVVNSSRHFASGPFRDTTLSGCRSEEPVRLVIDGFGVTERMRNAVRVVVSAQMAGRADYAQLSVVLTRLNSGAWTVFITDGVHLELVDGPLTTRILDGLKEAEQRMGASLCEEDRRVLAAIARAHGHGPRRPVALLDLAWAELGSEPAARESLQRLLLLEYLELTADQPGDELAGRLTDKGAEAIGYA
jgi:hypothetical protein